MKKKTIVTELEVFDHISELPADIQNLLNKAHEARKKAYAPYSHFTVGAAILMANGEIIVGNNQENAAFPSGLCAERVAAFQAGALYPNIALKTLAITASSSKKTNPTPIPPCGACRQSLAEYEVKQESSISVYFMGTEGAVVKANSIESLLPLVFDQSYLD